MFLFDFADRIYHVHIKDAKLNLNGRNGILVPILPSETREEAGTLYRRAMGTWTSTIFIRVLNQIGLWRPSVH